MSAPLAVATAKQELTTALNALDTWLGDNANADRWRHYLGAAELRAELAKEAIPDPAVLSRALDRFRSGAKGLDRAQFAVAQAMISNLLGELKRHHANDLPRLALEARDDHTPITSEQFASVQRALRDAASELNRQLGRDAALARGWKKYLQWEKLEPHLKGDVEPTRQGLADLDAVLLRLRANQPGLELPAFTRLAQAISRYRTLSSWAAAAERRDSRPDYEQRIAALGDAIDRHMERTTTETAWKVGPLLGLIDALGQSPEFVAAVRRRLAQPNIYGGVSAKFIRKLPDRTVDAQREVRDCILGVRQIGTAHTTGKVRYELAPSDNTVELMVYLDGQANSRTAGYKKPARVDSRGVTTFSAVKQVSLNDERFTSSPAVAAADTRSRILAVNKTGGQFGARLVRKIGWKRAHEQKRASEIVAAQHAEERVEGEFDEIVARDLASLRARYDEKIRAPLVRRNVVPEQLVMHSSAAGVEIFAAFAGRSQLAAPGPPPPPMAGHDMQLQIHESAVNNYLPLALASARIHQETAENPPDLSGNIPNWLKAISLAKPGVAATVQSGQAIIEKAVERIEEIQDLEEGPPQPAEKEPTPAPPPFKPYSITLNADAPVGVRFDDGNVIIRIRAASLVSEDAEYQNWDFIVTYRISVDQDNNIMLERVGEIEVFPTGFDPAWDTQLTAQQSGFRSTLAKNMNARAKSGQSFPAKIPIQPVRITRFGVLVLRELVADDGWLTVGWGLPYAEQMQDSPRVATPLPPARPSPTLVP